MFNIIPALGVVGQVLDVLGGLGGLGGPSTSGGMTELPPLPEDQRKKEQPENVWKPSRDVDGVKRYNQATGQWTDGGKPIEDPNGLKPSNIQEGQRAQDMSWVWNGRDADGVKRYNSATGQWTDGGKPIANPNGSVGNEQFFQYVARQPSSSGGVSADGAWVKDCHGNMFTLKDDRSMTVTTSEGQRTTYDAAGNVTSHSRVVSPGPML